MLPHIKWLSLDFYDKSDPVVEQNYIFQYLGQGWTNSVGTLLCFKLYIFQWQHKDKIQFPKSNI